MGKSIDGDRWHFGVFHGERQPARADSSLWRHTDQGALRHRLLVLSLDCRVDMLLRDRTYYGSSSNVRCVLVLKAFGGLTDIVENQPNLFLHNPTIH